MSAWALALALLGSGLRDEGLRACREGRYPDAVRLLEAIPSDEPTYDAWLCLGLARGRLQRWDGAREAFDRAIALDPGRPDALVERGGLSFLESRYEAAIPDLEKALVLKDDRYTRNLLASSLHLAGRPEEALAEWNVLGEPALRSLSIVGLNHVRDAVARREVSVAEGQVLELSELEATRARLGEVGVFDRVTLRPVPRGGGSADLEIALAENHGFSRGWADFLTVTGANAIAGMAELHYADIGGLGATFGALYRWQSARPLVSTTLTWPRPFGAPVYARLEAFRGRQAYVLDGGHLERRSHGFDLGLRHVVDGLTVVEADLRVHERTFSRARPDAPPGVLVGLGAALERRLVSSRREQLGAELKWFQASGLLGSDLAFARGTARLGSKTLLRPAEGSALEPSVLAAQVQWALGGSRMPLDEFLAPGGSPEMALPLRAHPQTDDGVLGGTPLGRSLVLANVELRQRFLKTTLIQVGGVAFYDGARIQDTTLGRLRRFHDVGLGLRLALPGASVLRFDYGHGLTDGRSAFFVGIREIF